MLAQRIYALALGYEGLNDHEQLRHDPMLALLSGNRPGAGGRWFERALFQDQLLGAGGDDPAEAAENRRAVEGDGAANPGELQQRIRLAEPV